MSDPSASDLAAENAELRARLAEAEETLEGIRSGGVDALVVSGQAGDQVFTLEGAETPYRLLIESINEGAATLTRDGTVLYCNGRFAEMAGVPAEQIVGASLWERVVPQHQEALRALVTNALQVGARAELTLSVPDRPELPVQLSLRPIHQDSDTIAVVVVDLTERKQAEVALQHANDALEERVRERTMELQATNRELTSFNQAMVGRELRMIELKQEVNGLCAQLGQPPRYQT
jgi:PAS domain S-box-containing protein